MDDRDILQSEQMHRMLLVRVFVVCAIVAVALVGAQFYFGVFKNPSLQLARAIPEDDPNAILKAKDTDRDGISDYDEANLYGTSPYLSDSDSDGIDDHTELTTGQDPNCPKGKSCAMVTELKDRVTATDIGVAEPGVMPSTTLDALEQLTNMTPSQVRELLKQNGVTDSVLKKLSDEDVMAAYRSALEKTGVAKTPDEVIPKNPTPAEIRVLLVKNGMSQSDADKIPDEELVKMYQDTLLKVNPQP